MKHVFWNNQNKFFWDFKFIQYIGSKVLWFWKKSNKCTTLVQTRYLKVLKYSLHVFVKFVINCVLQQLFELLVFHVFFGIEFYIGLKRFVTISQVKMIGNITFRCYELPLKQFHTNQNSSKYISSWYTMFFLYMSHSSCHGMYYMS